MPKTFAVNASTGEGGAGTPGGSDTQVQYNDSGAFGADSSLIRDYTNKQLISYGAPITIGASSNVVGTPYQTSGGYIFDGKKHNVKIYSSKLVSINSVYSSSFATASDVLLDTIDVPAYSADPVFNYDSGSYYTNDGYSHSIQVRAYKTVGGIKIFSSDYLDLSNFGDDGNGGQNYTITWEWATVTGADGYRVYKYDDWVSGAWYDVVGTNTFEDTGSDMFNQEYPSEDTFGIAWAFDAVAGADGYRLLGYWEDNYNYDRYADVATNSYDDLNSWTLGNTVTPTTLYNPSVVSYGGMKIASGSYFANLLTPVQTQDVDIIFPTAKPTNPSFLRIATNGQLSYDASSYSLSSHNHAGVYEVPLTFSGGLNRVTNTITALGPFAASIGSASAPAYSFANGTSYGLYGVGSPVSAIALATNNGTGYIYGVGSTGKWGVNYSNPGSALTVAGGLSVGGSQLYTSTSDGYIFADKGLMIGGRSEGEAPIYVSAVLTAAASAQRQIMKAAIQVSGVVDTLPMSNVYGMNFSSLMSLTGTSATLTNYYSTNLALQIVAGTITNWYGLRIVAPTAGGTGAITNKTAVLIDNGSGNVLLGNGKVGVQTATPSFDYSIGAEATRTIGVERRSTNNLGSDLTINAGGGYVGGTNRNGGNLYLVGGISTGSGVSNVYLQTATAGSSGTTDVTPTTKMSILGNGDIELTNLISKYNNIATVSNGVPSELATVDLTAQSAAITATTLYAIPSTGAGMYRVSWVATVTTAASTSSVLGGTNGFQLKYTDGNDSVVKTSNPTTVTSSAGNTTATSISESFLAYCKASTNLQYLFDYTSVGVTAMQYNLHIKVEAL